MRKLISYIYFIVLVLVSNSFAQEATQSNNIRSAESPRYNSAQSLDGETYVIDRDFKPDENNDPGILIYLKNGTLLSKVSRPPSSGFISQIIFPTPWNTYILARYDGIKSVYVSRAFELFLDGTYRESTFSLSGQIYYLGQSILVKKYTDLDIVRKNGSSLSNLKVTPEDFYEGSLSQDEIIRYSKYGLSFNESKRTIIGRIELDLSPLARDNLKSKSSSKVTEFLKIKNLPRVVIIERDEEGNFLWKRTLPKLNKLEYYGDSVKIHNGKYAIKILKKRANRAVLQDGNRYFSISFDGKVMSEKKGRI